MTFGDNPDNPFRNFRFPPRNPGSAGPRRIGALPLTVIILTVIAVVLVSLSGFYADFLWFRSVDYSSVWTTLLTTRVTLFFIFGLLTSLIITSNIYMAYKKRPIYVPVTVEADNLERYRAQIEPIRKVGLIGIFLRSSISLEWLAPDSGRAGCSTQMPPTSVSQIPNLVKMLHSLCLPCHSGNR